MSAPSDWYEPHGLHSQPEQNQAWRSGTRHQRVDTPDPSASTDYTFTFIMPHYYLHSPPIIHATMILFIHCRWMLSCWGCLLGGVGLQGWVCEEWACLKKRIVGAVSAWLCIPLLDCISVANFSAESLLKVCGFNNLVFFSVTSSIKLWKVHKLFSSADT